MTFENLLGGIAPTLLPADPALDELIAHGSEQFVEIASRHLDSSLCWAILSEGALAAATPDAELMAYAFARTGYHRGLDALRKNGWRGSGPVPWEHEPNRGFLRCLAALARLSGSLGDGAEHDRCWQFLRDSSETGYQVLQARKDAVPVADLVRDVTAADGPEPRTDEPPADDVTETEATADTTGDAAPGAESTASPAASAAETEPDASVAAPVTDESAPDVP
ncbi:DUF3151 family protein [Propionicicella superfundia]|uniref:DUF3151 family protein n=1 Tax=Propionicicella superfundia TaxID=348582 RepID=UPI00042808EF